jgi:hypothetical protein
MKTVYKVIIAVVIVLVLIYYLNNKKEYISDKECTQTKDCKEYGLNYICRILPNQTYGKCKEQI